MLRDLKFFRHNSGKNQEGNENIPAGSETDSLSVPTVLDPKRPPLNTILESTQNPRTGSEHEPDPRGKIERTPSKRAKTSDSSVSFRTPEKLGLGGSAKSKFGWAQRGDIGFDVVGAQDDGSLSVGHHPPSVRASSFGNASLTNTPRGARYGVRTLSNHSESGSTQNTPTKSVTKPPNPTLTHSRPPLNIGTRTANFSLMSKGVSSSCVPSTIVNTVEVPHFELKEDPSFWMDHNVQVLIRIRPLNNMERTSQGYNRCLKQDSAQTVAWIGQPETRFTFDHVACETVNQEMLFRVAGLPMVENCLSGYNSSIFAYGQTGSGKTYTMLGEINELELRPSTDRGMTPRIFEFLFARIRAEEESRVDENLKYNCKCSFLEIYNEQITDLLDPSSTNLLLREDVRKGVYVENSTEYEVETVNDILKLLIQGAANRKVAATNMNRESSRSHCVFTCVIESRWEKDSTINLRYARLNLVDLAGSERQKTSGAEGDRLKEAANINKSLSTLGHVIMVLVDLAQGGKHKHVPYRDSRLTFLLQDSLGGNSKTMIIANVSPSICSAAETFSTLKFAQRAKLIQNNAIVNEDASGDISALQCQVRLLKEELSFLKRQNVSRSHSFQSAIIGTTEGEGGNTTAENKMLGMADKNPDEFQGSESSDTIRFSTKKLKSLETILAGALRREQMADNTVKQLQAEIEQLNRLVRQREEDGRCSKMLLRFREDKIQRIESLVNGSIPSDSYLTKQNEALSEEIQLLCNRIDRNPEVTRFALENIRLLDELRRFQEFYEEGEREILLSELSLLRNQLLEYLSGRFSQPELTVSKDEPQGIMFSAIPRTTTKEDCLKNELEKTQVELNECRTSLKSCLQLNEKLTRELDDLNSQFNKFRSQFCGQNDHSQTLQCQEVLSSATRDQEHVIVATRKKAEQNVTTDTSHHEIMIKHSEEIMNFQLELDILKIILDEERLSRNAVEQKASQLQKDLEVSNDELKDAKSVIEALESQQVPLINELEELRQTSNHYVEFLARRDPFLKPSKDEDSPLQSKLKRMQASLECAKKANIRYQSDQASLTSQQQEMEAVQSQVEAETAEVIVCLQEELATLQQQVDELSRKELEAREENKQLHGILEERNMELRSLTEEWDRLACHVSDVLADGHISIQEASDELEGFTESLPHRRIWMGEQMGRMVRLIIEKELLIEELQKSLEDVYKVRDDLEWKLRYLRGATLEVTESHQEERYEREKEIHHLKSKIQEQKSAITDLENMLKTGEEKIRKAEVCATVAFMTVNRLSDKDLKKEALKLHTSEEGPTLSKFKLTEDMESEISDDVLEAQGRLNEFRNIVCAVNSTIDEYVADVGRSNKLDNLKLGSGADGDEKSGGWIETSKCSSKKVCDKDEIIYLLRKEIESALESLKGVQIQMADLLIEREEIKKAEKEDSKTIKHLKDQVVELERLMNGMESFAPKRMLEMANKLQNLEEMVQKSKEGHQSQLSTAKMLLAQKAAESISLISKFEEAQATIAEADVMVNALLTANEAAKLEVEKYKQIEMSLESERDCLNMEVESLQSRMDLMDQKYNNLERQYNSNMAETRSLACLFEDLFADVESTFKQDLASIFVEIHDLRLQLMNYVNLARTWLEDVWSDIIAKDCAMSVFHLCHMAILLETVTGLNAENSLLEHGLSESNSVISDLRESTLRAKRELQMCTSLKGKLLADINNSFSRITKNEEDAGKLSSRINLFEKKIVDLQMQEDSMLSLSNSMGMQLSALMKDVDGNYRHALTTLLSQERSLCEIEEVFRYSVLRGSNILSNESCGGSRDPAECIPGDTDLPNNQVEFVMVNMLAKDFHLFILASELKEKISELNEFTIWKSNKKIGEDKLAEALEDLSRELILVTTEDELGKLMLIEAEARLDNLENSSLQSDLMRKEEIVKGLLFDLSLLQESTSKMKDQKDDFEEMEVRLESLEEDLAIKCNELDAALLHTQELQEKLNAIAALQLDLGTAQESLHILSEKNFEMKAEIDDILLSKETIQEELVEKRKMAEQLELENLKMSVFLEDLKCDFIKINQEKEYLESETITLKEQLGMAQVLAEEREAVATEAQQVAQMNKTYAEEKEEEAKLLEKSVEELECTINVLENKVELVRGEAERQRTEREVLELQLQALRHQIQASEDPIQPPSFEENGIKLQEAENNIQTLEKLIVEKDAEISQCKMHITELNMHAEAQAREYKQKFKALEAMVQEVRPEPISHAATLAAAKSEKNSVKSRASGSPHAGKSRGSGSPFKCIGLGLAHQFNSEKDEELTAGRLRIEELEALAASRQKEIFMLNTRLAAAESMTHDVIRDLLGVKLDMTNCASVLDHQQVEQIAEKARIHNGESGQKDQEVAKLEQQLNEFVNERQSWLDEINHKHEEMVAAHIALKKLHQRDQLLTAENEMLKLDNANHKRKVVELENEVKKLSGQQNLQQRIHHHAKIKEENNLLRTQNDDLATKLKRSEITLSHVKEQLSSYCSSRGKSPYVDIDEEQELRKQLQDTEEERVQLAQKLLGMCTSILKAAGITRSVPDITPSMAEEALGQLIERIASTERDLQDLKFKCKISNEKMRLSDLCQQSSPLTRWTNENSPPTPVRSPRPLSPLSR